LCLQCVDPLGQGGQVHRPFLGARPLDQGYRCPDSLLHLDTNVCAFRHSVHRGADVPLMVTQLTVNVQENRSHGQILSTNPRNAN
jgi:hypothetical protein